MSRRYNSVSKLVAVAQKHDERARQFRDGGAEYHPGFDYATSRRLAFRSRKMARELLDYEP